MPACLRVLCAMLCAILCAILELPTLIHAHERGQQTDFQDTAQDSRTQCSKAVHLAHSCSWYESKIARRIVRPLLLDALELGYELPESCPLRPELDLHGTLTLLEKHGPSGANPFACRQCSKRFVTPYHLHRHILRMHAEQHLCRPDAKPRVCLGSYCSLLGCDVELYHVAQAYRQGVEYGTVGGSSSLPSFVVPSRTTADGTTDPNVQESTGIPELDNILRNKPNRIDLNAEAEQLLKYHSHFTTPTLEATAFIDGIGVIQLPPPFAMQAPTPEELQVLAKRSASALKTRDLFNSKQEANLRANGHPNSTSVKSITGGLFPCSESTLRRRRLACYKLMDACFPVTKGDSRAIRLNILESSAICDRLACGHNGAPRLPPTRSEFLERLRSHLAHITGEMSARSQQQREQAAVVETRHMLDDLTWHWSVSHTANFYIWSETARKAVSEASPHLNFKPVKLESQMLEYDDNYPQTVAELELGTQSSILGPSSLRLLWRMSLGVLCLAVAAYYLAVWLCRPKPPKRKDRPLVQSLEESERLLEASDHALSPRELNSLYRRHGE